MTIKAHSFRCVPFLLKSIATGIRRARNFERFAKLAEIFGVSID